MRQSRIFAVLALLIAGFGVSKASGQESVGSFSYAELSEGGADRSSIATFGYNYEGGLVWKCEANGLNVLFILPDALGSGSADEIFIEYGFGGAAPANRLAWKFNPDELLATMPQAAVGAFTQAARGAGSITVRAVDPESGGDATYELTLDQLSSALQRLDCGAS